MFTGIVEDTGRVVASVAAAGGVRLRIETALAPTLALGASLAVNGVCLTVVEHDAVEVAADIGPETARVTTLGAVGAGRQVNLERPLRLDGRLDGHLVLGHVDGVGRVEAIRHEAESHWLSIGFPAGLASYFIAKGSVAVDGVSLTVAALGATRLDVQIIPYTWAHTTLSTLRAGELVNLECDMVGKYVLRALESR